MIRVHPFAAEDLSRIAVHAGQVELAGVDRDALGRAYAASGMAFTARDADDGAIVMCGGALEAHRDHATMWAALSPDAGRAMTALTRRTLTMLRALRHRRIDAYVPATHDAGHRWMALLHFRFEAPLADWLPDGGTMIVYRWERH
jgi:hypothetical protein